VTSGRVGRNCSSAAADGTSFARGRGTQKG
jgi:hypothetical protein